MSDKTKIIQRLEYWIANKASAAPLAELRAMRATVDKYPTINTTVLDAAIQVKSDALIDTSDFADIIRGAQSLADKPLMSPVITAPNATGELLKAGTEIYLEQLTNTYHKKDGLLCSKVPIRRVSDYSNNGMSISIRTDDGNVFGFSLETDNSASTSYMYLHQFKSDAISNTVSYVGATVVNNASNGSYSNKVIKNPVKVADNTWVAIMTQIATYHPRLVKFTYDPNTGDMTVTSSTTSYNQMSVYSSHNYAEIVPTFDGSFWLMVRVNNSGSRIGGYRVNIDTMTYGTEYDTIITDLGASRSNPSGSGSIAFAFVTSDGNMVFPTSNTMELKSFDGSNFLDVGTVAGSPFLEPSSVAIIKVKEDTWFSIYATASNGIYKQQVITYDPVTTTLTISAQVVKVFPECIATAFNVSLSYPATIVEGNKLISFNINNKSTFVIIALDIDTFAAPNVGDITIHNTASLADDLLDFPYATIGDGFITSLLNVGGSTRAYYSLRMPVSVPIGSLINNRAPMKVGYLKSDATVDDLEIVVTENTISTEGLVTGNVYDKNIAISDSLLLVNLGSTPPMYKVQYSPVDKRVTGQAFSTTGSTVTYVFGGDYLTLSNGRIETVENIESLDKSVTFSGSFAINSNTTTGTRALAMLMMIDGVPCSKGTSSVGVNYSSSAYTVTYEYSKAKSMKCYAMSAYSSNIHMFMKEGKI